MRKLDSKYRRGQKFNLSHGECRIMEIVEGYVVARMKGAAPFVEGLKEFDRRVRASDKPVIFTAPDELINQIIEKAK